jgi:hypothetical protein
MGSLPLVMAVAVAAAFARQARTTRALLLVAGAMIGSYYAVWVLSPVDTVWLVSTSFDRLLLQVWPALVFTAFYGVGLLQSPRAAVAAPRGVALDQ